MWLRALVALSSMAIALSFTAGGRSPFIVPIVGFDSSSTVAFRGHTGQTTPSPRPLSSSLFYGVYGWGENDDYNEYASIDHDIFGPSPSSSAATAIAESILEDRERTGSLARLAAAFSPPGQALDIHNLERVGVLAVDENHIEIEAVVCEDQSCVTLCVPVAFPHKCGSDAELDALRGCVLSNLDELDSEAGGILRHTEAELANHDACLDELCSQFSKTEYPSWWIPPECNNDLVAECDTITRLLNDEEFQGGVNALARKGLETLNLADVYEVTKAVVADVGPAGLCLRARAALRSQCEDREAISVLDVPLPFGGEPRQDAASLRAAVLGAVAAAEAD